MVLTPKQKELYDFLREYWNSQGVMPTVREIREHLGLASNFAVQKRLAALQKKGYLGITQSRAARNLRLVGEVGESVLLEVLGVVTAGVPIEALEVPEPVEVPRYLLQGTDNFALRVKGDSMMDANIEDGDIIIVKPQEKAEHGQIVVALINGEATVKKLDLSGERVVLRPCNRSGAYQPLVVGPEDQFELRGVVVGLLRRYRK